MLELLLNVEVPTPVTLLSRLIRKGPDSREAMRPLWHRVVEIAREKPWYASLGVTDTVAGRFDAVTLVTALVMLRMERDLPGDTTLVEPSARLTELFVEDMDGQLRQSGVGDLVVGKHIGRLMGALGGRIVALREALGQGDAALAEVLERNVTLIEGAQPLAFAAEVRRLHGQIDALAPADLIAGRIVR